MKILHTADLHLGQIIYQNYERNDEHDCFFSQLERWCQEEQPDALIVSGDVFDIQQPSAAVWKSFTDRFVRLHQASPTMHLVIVAGNHDSASRIQSNHEIWKLANTHLIGTPPPADFTSAKMFINSISTDMVSSQGTAIGSAIKLAMNSFSSNDKIQKTIIVITDGENFEDDAVMAAKNAVDKGVTVNVIGVGSTKGSPIPLGNGAWMKDGQGNVVTTYLNEQTAQQIAKAGNGVYVAGSAGDAASRMSEELNKLAKSDLQKVVYSQNSEQFPIFAWIALVFLIGDMFVLERKNSWLKKINFFTKEDKQRHGK